MKRELLILLLVSGTAIPAVPVPNDDVPARINQGYSFCPVLGVNPTYGLILGGAAFRGETHPPASNGSLVFNASLKNNYDIELNYTFWDRNRLFYVFGLTWSNFFDPYFGQGDLTHVGDEKKIDGKHEAFTPSVWYRLDPEVSLGLYSEQRYREETGVNGDPSQRVFGTEFTPIFGLSLVYDGRDNQIDTHRGPYLRLSVDTGPSALSSRRGAQTFVRMEGEARYFTPLFDWLILAGQVEQGVSAGSPSFLYEYTLGGSARLRGYQNGRLLGDQYYLAQAEARFILLRWLSAAAFGGLGDVAAVRFADFTGLKATGGFGLRFGLPPNFVAKARLDLGFAPDETNFYLTFNEAF